MKYVFLILTSTFLASQAVASSQLTPIEMSHKTSKPIIKNIQYIIDKEGNLETQSVINKAGLNWQKPTTDNLVFDLDDQKTWIKFSIHNIEDENLVAHLELEPVFLEYIDLYDATGNLIDQTGSMVKSLHRDAFPTLRLDVKPGIQDYYLSMQSRGSALTIFLRSDSQFLSKSFFDLALFCFLLGGLFALMLYHLFLYATYRYKTYLFYSVFVAGIMLFTITFTSYHKHILPSYIHGFPVSFWWSGISAHVAFFCMYLFAAELLHIAPWKKDTKHRLLSKVLLCLPMTSLICITSVFLINSPQVLVAIRFSSLLYLLALPPLGVYLWYKERKNIIALLYSLSWVPFAIGSILILAWLQGVIPHYNIISWTPPIGVLAQSILLSFAAGQRLNAVTRDKIREQNEKLQVMRELEVHAGELQKRNEVITSFTSSEILSELDRGENPLEFKPCTVEKCTVFVDMHGFTAFSESHSTYECHRTLNQFFNELSHVTYQGGGRVDKLIGDAMLIVFDDPKKCLLTIVALRSKLNELNKQRVESLLPPVRFGIGVSYGPMLAANFGSSYKLDRTIVGDTVNVASRLEAITREFSVDVLCSKEFVDLHPEYEFFRPSGYVLLKGRQRKSLVYEAFEHCLPEVIKWKKYTRPFIRNIIRLELDGKYDQAITGLEELVKKCPPHSYKDNEIMDITLKIMIEAIRNKVKNLEQQSFEIESRAVVNGVS